MKKCSKILLFGLVALICVAPSLRAESWREYFKDGIHYFNIGDYQKASESLQMAVEMNPAGQDLKAARDGIGPAFWSKLLANPQTRTSGYKLLNAVYIYEEKMRRNDEYIEALVESLVASETDFQLRWQTVHKLVAVGQFACPRLIDYLGTARNEDARKAVRMSLEKLSYRAVLPLIEALSAESLLTRENAIIILGEIGDPRAAAPLKALLESDAQPEKLKSLAEKALVGIQAAVLESKVFGSNIEIVTDKGELVYKDHRGKGLFEKDGSFKSARELYLYKALRYLRETEYTAEEAAKNEGIIWIWNNQNQKLENMQVPLYAYNEMMAEEAGYDCLNLFPEYTDIIPVLISSIAAQIVEAQNLMALADDRGMATNLPQGEKKEELANRLEILKEAFVLVNLVGADHLYKALEINCQRIAMIMGGNKTDRLIKDYREYGFDAETFQYLCIQLRNPEVARWEQNLLLTSDNKNDKDAMADPLTAALQVEDKRIRFGAAITLAHLSPTKSFNNQKDVVSNLAKALGESRQQVVLLVSKSMNDLNRLSSLTGGLGYVPQIANSGSEGLKKAKQFPVDDVIVVDAREAQLNLMVDAFGNKIDADFAGQTVRSFVKEMKADLYTRSAPIVFVVTDEEQEAQYSNDDFFSDKVAGYIRWGYNEPIAEDYFADMVNKVIGETELKEKNKEDAFNIAAEAAIALSKIDIDTSVLGQYVKDAVPTLIEVIESREDPIKVPSIDALGVYREQEAIEPIVRVLNHPRSSKDARLACIRALGRIDPSNGEAYEALKRVLTDSDFDIRKEAGVALGHTTLESTRLLELLEQQRIEKGAKER